MFLAMKEAEMENKYTAPMIPTIIMIAVTNFAAMMNTTSVTILLPVFMMFSESTSAETMLLNL